MADQRPHQAAANGTHGGGPSPPPTPTPIKEEPGTPPEPNAASKRSRNGDAQAPPLCTVIPGQAPSAQPVPEDHPTSQPTKKPRRATYTALCCTCNSKTAKCMSSRFCACVKANRKCTRCACANCENTDVPIQHRTAHTNTIDADTQRPHDDGFIGLDDGTGATPARATAPPNQQPDRDMLDQDADAAAAAAAAEDDTKDPTPPASVEECGDLPEYELTPTDRWLDDLYGDHTHQNDGTHLDGGIADDKDWQARMATVIPYASRLFHLPRGGVATRYLGTLADLIVGTLDRKWNSERVIIFIMTIGSRFAEL